MTDSHDLHRHSARVAGIGLGLLMLLGLAVAACGPGGSGAGSTAGTTPTGTPGTMETPAATTGTGY